MAGIRYERDISGTRKLMTSPAMLALMEARANLGARAAAARAPEESGEYSRSWEVTGRRRGGPRGNRAEARLTNTTAYADDVEFRHRVLGRTVDDIERGI